MKYTNENDKAFALMKYNENDTAAYALVDKAGLDALTVKLLKSDEEHLSDKGSTVLYRVFYQMSYYLNEEGGKTFNKLKGVADSLMRSGLSISKPDIRNLQREAGIQGQRNTLNGSAFMDAVSGVIKMPQKVAEPEQPKVAPQNNIIEKADKFAKDCKEMAQEATAKFKRVLDPKDKVYHSLLEGKNSKFLNKMIREQLEFVAKTVAKDEKIPPSEKRSEKHRDRVGELVTEKDVEAIAAALKDQAKANANELPDKKGKSLINKVFSRPTTVAEIKIDKLSQETEEAKKRQDLSKEVEKTGKWEVKAELSKNNEVEWKR